MSPNTSVLSTNEEHFVRLMQLLGDKTRFQIFKLIAKNEQLCVSEIAQHLDLSVSAVSQHFKLLEDFGIVTKTRFGQKICYRLQANSMVNDLLQLIS